MVAPVILQATAQEPGSVAVPAKVQAASPPSMMVKATSPPPADKGPEVNGVP